MGSTEGNGPHGYDGGTVDDGTFPDSTRQGAAPGAVEPRTAGVVTGETPPDPRVAQPDPAEAADRNGHPDAIPSAVAPETGPGPQEPGEQDRYAQSLHPQAPYSEALHPQAAHPQAAHPQAAHPQVAHPQAAHPQAPNSEALHPEAPHPQAQYPHGAPSPPQQPYPGAPFAEAGATPPGVYPPGSWPPGAYGPGPHPPGAYPPGSWPPGGYPPAVAGPAPEPPAKRTHRWGLGAFLLVEGIFLLVSVLVGFFALPGSGPLSAGVITASLLIPPIVAAGAALVITSLRGNGPRQDLGLVWSWRDVGLGLAFGFGGLFLTAVAATVFVSIVGPDVSSAVGDVFTGVRAGPVMALVVLLSVVVIVPLCEEILYRGLLWGGLERLGTNRWVTFALTTVIFALFHFEFTRAPLLAIIAIPIGLARVFTGRLLASVVAHQVNNLLPGLVLAAGLLGWMPPV